MGKKIPNRKPMSTCMGVCTPSRILDQPITKLTNSSSTKLHQLFVTMKNMVAIAEEANV